MRGRVERAVVVCTSFVLASTGGLAAQPVAVGYNPTTSRHEIRRVNPSTGQTTLLDTFASDSGTWSFVSFVLDPGLDTLYALSPGGTLYRFSALTGALLTTVSVDTSLQDLDLRDTTTLLGIAYNPSTQQNEIRSVDPATGKTSILNSFAFDSGWWVAGSLVVDRRRGTFFAVSASKLLYHFDLRTGAVLATIPLEIDTILQCLALRDANTLVAVAYDQVTQLNEIRSVDIVTGRTSLLNSLAFDSGSWRSIAVDRARSRFYVISGADTLYAFDLRTGAILSMAPIGVPLRVLMADAETPRARPVQDFDGDTRTDPTVFRPTNGTWYQLRSSAGTGRGVAWGVDGDVPVPADYDGDGRPDEAVFRPSSATWFVLASSSGTGMGVQWGLPGDVPVPADYDGDAIADVAVFRPSNGTWYIIRSSTKVAVAVPWGAPGDLPVPADFDGDGKADPTVFRPLTGTWYELRTTTGAGYGVTWGQVDDQPIAGDYDGDGRADPTVFRPSSGTWFQLRSGTGSGVGLAWGRGGDIPVLGDYDGDGRADPTVFRASNGWWYQFRSTTRTGYGVRWGAPGDLPTSMTITPAMVLPPAAVTLSGPEAAAVGVTVTFTATVTPSTARVKQYRFDWGDGTFTITPITASSALAAHAYWSTGQYTVTVEVTGNSGETLSTYAVITVTHF